MSSKANNSPLEMMLGFSLRSSLQIGFLSGDLLIFRASLDVSENRGFSPKKSSILNRAFQYFHHPFWGVQHPYHIRWNFLETLKLPVSSGLFGWAWRCSMYKQRHWRDGRTRWRRRRRGRFFSQENHRGRAADSSGKCVCVYMLTRLLL